MVFITKVVNQARVEQYSVIEVTLNVMKEHINDLDICEQGCDALMNITKDDSRTTQ